VAGLNRHGLSASRRRASSVAAPLLLLIDFQKAFDAIAAATPRNNPEAEARAARLLAHWRAKGWPVIHVRHDSTEAGSPLRPGAPGNAFMDFAEPQPGETVLAKCVNSAFIGTDLDARLKALGPPPLVLAGISTDHCVSTTVRMAGNLGYAVTLAGDAAFTFDRRAPSGRIIPADAVHEAHLASLSDEFATVASVADILRANP
jgi:nicotinamidase-related amidase